jgi:energy-coupling factor transport system substrate-specific component
VSARAATGAVIGTATGAARVAARLGPRSALFLTLASVAGLLMFVWPLLLRPEPDVLRAGGEVAPPFVFLLLLPVVVLVVVAELTEDGMDSKALAMLGVLTAVNAALRPLGGGLAGVELVFFLLVLAGRVFGPGFGFVLGCTSLFASALMTAGVGPWLPFQMLVAGWVGMVAGLLPRRVSGRREIVMLAVYGVFAAYAYGLMTNLWGWPFILGIQVPGQDSTDLSYVPGAPMLENLQRFFLYTLFTSTLGWDTGRAITNALAISLLGPAVLTTLRRAARRARVERR